MSRMRLLALALVVSVAAAAWARGWSARTGTPRGVSPPAGRALAGGDRIFPPAAAALATTRFRIAGVHFWQGNWNYNFWSNLKTRHLDEDLRRIRALGFNTIVLTVPWGVFQPEADPPTYDVAAYLELDHVLRAAAEHRLYVVLRVGTLERIPKGVMGDTFSAPYLFFDDHEIASYCDLFRETARRMAAHANLLFMFYSWEEVMGFLPAAQQPEAVRVAYARRAPAFAGYLRTRPLVEWNRQWGTTYESYEAVPFPEYATAAFRELLRFADDRLLHVILPGVAEAVREGSERVRLSFEIRIDAEPIMAGGRIVEYVDHKRTWNLPPAYALITAYFNPYWSALNRGDFITSGVASRNFESLLSDIRQATDGRPLFFDQFNFIDSTPAFRHNSRLRGEAEIGAFLDRSLPLLFGQSLGYALWSLDTYEANVLDNSTFEEALRGWQTSDPARPGDAAQTADTVRPGATARSDAMAEVREDAAREERYLALPPGASIQQTVHAGWNPGAASPEVPYTFRMLARGEVGGVLTLRYETRDGDRWVGVMEQAITPSAEWSTYEARWPFAPDFRLTLSATGRVAVDVDQLSAFNHLQEAAIYGPRGEKLGRRAEVVASHNRRWLHLAGW